MVHFKRRTTAVEAHSVLSIGNRERPGQVFDNSGMWYSIKRTNYARSVPQKVTTCQEQHQEVSRRADCLETFQHGRILLHADKRIHVLMFPLGGQTIKKPSGTTDVKQAYFNCVTSTSHSHPPFMQLCHKTDMQRTLSSSKIHAAEQGNTPSPYR